MVMSMNIVFMGTPDFAVPSLKALIDAGHNIMRVYSQPDRPKGRGHKMQYTPVKELALEHNIEVFQPTTFKDEDTVKDLASLKPELIVVVAYGKILPKSVLEIPKKGCINVHGSLLPKYRGAAPIQWAVLNGDEISGVCTMFMAEGMDTGDVLLTAKTEIGEYESSGELFDRLMIMGANLLTETIDKLDEITPIKQDESKASHAPMINKEMSIIDFNKTAKEIKCLVYGLNPWPSAKMMINGRNIKVFSVKITEDKGKAGELFSKGSKLCVYCGDASLELLEIQPENGKRMSGESFLLGNPIER